MIIVRSILSFTGTPSNGSLPIGNGQGFTINTLTAGTNITITNGPGTITIDAAGGGGSPAGSTNEIQFNNAGAFAADSDLRWIASDDRLVLGQENTADTNSRMVVIGKGISTNNTFVVHNSTGTNNALVVRDDGRIMVGTTTPNGSYGVTVEQSVSASLVGISVKQLSSSGNSGSAYNLVANNGNGRIIKASGGWNYKFSKNNDLILLNDANGGNICLLADYSGGLANNGEIHFGAGGSATAQVILRKSGSLDINSAEESSAILNVASTTRGFLPPRMTTAQRDLIATPAAGLLIYNTTTNKFSGYDGTNWNDFH